MYPPEPPPPHPLIHIYIISHAVHTVFLIWPYSCGPGTAGNLLCQPSKLLTLMVWIKMLLYRTDVKLVPLWRISAGHVRIYRQPRHPLPHQLYVAWGMLSIDIVAFIHIGGLQRCLSCARPAESQPPLLFSSSGCGRAESHQALQTTTQHGSLDDKIGRVINKC